MPRRHGKNARGPASAGDRPVDLEGEERSAPANRFARCMLHDSEEQLAAQGSVIPGRAVVAIKEVDEQRVAGEAPRLLAGAPSVGVLVEDLGERMGHARAGDACAEVLAAEVSA